MDTQPVVIMVNAQGTAKAAFTSVNYSAKVVTVGRSGPEAKQLARPVIDCTAPKAPRLGLSPARIEHRQRRIVTEDHRRGDNPVKQALVQQIEPLRRPSDPPSQG